jgi:thiol-disulfide isomerase/thioredoxin
MRNILRPVCLGAVLGLFAAVSSIAADEKFSQLKVGTEVYSNVVVTTVTATDIYFSHSRGMGNAKLKSLSPELREHFHFNAAKASEVEKQHREGNALYREALATNTPPAAAREHKGAAENDRDVVVPGLYARSFLGEHAPDLYVEQWLSAPGNASDKLGLVIFWRPDSDPCREAIPQLNELHEKFTDQVSFIALTDKPADDVKKMTSPQFNFPIGLDSEARTMRVIELKAVPYVMLVDKKGIVRFEGPPDYLTEKVLQRLLDKYGDE